jgi:hypothetical protein
MTSKMTIDQAALAKQIRGALAATAATLGKALEQATTDLPVQRSERFSKGEASPTTKNGHEFTWTGTGDISAVQLHEGVVLKNGDRLPANRWTVTAQAEVNLADEFRKHL